MKTLRTLALLLLIFSYACDKEAGRMYSENYCECVTKWLDGGIGYPIKVCNTDSVIAFKKKKFTPSQLEAIFEENKCD